MFLLCAFSYTSWLTCSKVLWGLHILPEDFPCLWPVCSSPLFLAQAIKVPLSLGNHTSSLKSTFWNETVFLTMLVYSKDSGRGGRNVVLGKDVGKKQVVNFVVCVFVFTNRIDELCRPFKWKSFNGNLSWASYWDKNIYVVHSHKI